MYTKKNSLYISGLLLVLISISLWFYLGRGKDSDKSTSSKVHDSSANNSKSQDYLTKNNRNWPEHLNDEINFLLAAFESKDADLLRRRVQELLDKDWEKALKVFAELDYTFLHYKMSFPHDVVATHLAKLHPDSEVMEILSAYINQSSILASVMDIHFKNWMRRDYLEQFSWFKENTTFIDSRIMISYVEEIGDSENGKEATRLLGELPDDDQRKRWVYQKAMEYLASEQPAKFGEYLSELDVIPDYTAPAVYNLAVQLISKEAAEYPLETIQRAKEWLDLVEDKDLRLNYLAQTAAEFKYGHPEEFESWLPSVTFESENDRNRFLSEMDVIHSSIETAHAEREQLERIPEEEQNLLSPFSE